MVEEAGLVMQLAGFLHKIILLLSQFSPTAENLICVVGAILDNIFHFLNKGHIVFNILIDCLYAFRCYHILTGFYTLLKDVLNRFDHKLYINLFFAKYLVRSNTKTNRGLIR